MVIYPSKHKFRIYLGFSAKVILNQIDSEENELKLLEVQEICWATSILENLLEYVADFLTH